LLRLAAQLEKEQPWADEIPAPPEEKGGYLHLISTIFTTPIPNYALVPDRPILKPNRRVSWVLIVNIDQMDTQDIEGKGGYPGCGVCKLYHSHEARECGKLGPLQGTIMQRIVDIV
jgi:hypothetical protein